MDNQVTITPLTTYRSEDGTALWDVRRIALESMLSKGAIRSLIAEDPEFPTPYAVGDNGRAYYRELQVREWINTSEALFETMFRKSQGLGRPTKQHLEVIKATRA